MKWRLTGLTIELYLENNRNAGFFNFQFMPMNEWLEYSKVPNKKIGEQLVRLRNKYVKRGNANILFTSNQFIDKNKWEE